MSEDRYPALYVRGLQELGFFAAGQRVGVIATNLHPAGHDALLAALSAAGVHVTVDQVVPSATSRLSLSKIRFHHRGQPRRQQSGSQDAGRAQHRRQHPDRSRR